eukprot:Nk52_evm1s389 gene=Nk52_evmTU1s389
MDWKENNQYGQTMNYEEPVLINNANPIMGNSFNMVDDLDVYLLQGLASVNLNMGLENDRRAAAATIEESAADGKQKGVFGEGSVNGVKIHSVFDAGDGELCLPRVQHSEGQSSSGRGRRRGGRGLLPGLADLRKNKGNTKGCRGDNPHILGRMGPNGGASHRAIQKRRPHNKPNALACLYSASKTSEEQPWEGLLRERAMAAVYSYSKTLGDQTRRLSLSIDAKFRQFVDDSNRSKDDFAIFPTASAKIGQNLDMGEEFGNVMCGMSADNADADCQKIVRRGSFDDTNHVDSELMKMLDAGRQVNSENPSLTHSGTTYESNSRNEEPQAWHRFKYARWRMWKLQQASNMGMKMNGYCDPKPHQASNHFSTYGPNTPLSERDSPMISEIE